MTRKWMVFAAIALIYMVQTAATFTSLGVVLPAMMQDLHWSYGEAGLSFSLLGLSCGLSSPLAGYLIRRFDSRMTIVLGGLALTSGFLGVAAAGGLTAFYGLMVVIGIGISLVANIPGIQLVVNWFTRRPAAAIGFYMMIGAFGGVVGPEAVNSVLAATGSWRAHWIVMAAAILSCTLLCLVTVRETPPGIGSDEEPDPVRSGKPASAFHRAEDWSYGEAVRTPQFIILTAIMIVTVMSTFTANSAVVSHLIQRGFSPALSAHALSLQALLAMAAKGVGGALGERIEPRRLLMLGLALTAVGFGLLAILDRPWMIYAFGVAFGLGWGLCYLSVAVLIVNYFGRKDNGMLMSTLWFFTTLATFGPALAGFIADRFGSFSPSFLGYVVVLAMALAAAAVMRPPWTIGRPQLVPSAAPYL